MEPCIALYNKRDATNIKFFIIINTLHVSGRLSAHHQEPTKLYVQPRVLSCLIRTPLVYGPQLRQTQNGGWPRGLVFTHHSVCVLIVDRGLVVTHHSVCVLTVKQNSKVYFLLFFVCIYKSVKIFLLAT